MTESVATVPAVWVLIFDRYPPDVASAGLQDPQDLHSTGGLTPAAAREHMSPFDRLDLESTCFEQFLLQDVRSERSTEDVFGGEAAFRKLADAMSAAGQTASLVGITDDGASFTKHENSDAMTSLLRRCGVPFLRTIHLDCSSHDAAFADESSGNSGGVFLANLVWMEAQLSSSVSSAETVLDNVFRRLESRAGQEGPCPVLMVTFRAGNDRDVQEPFRSGVAENRLHVPLWIRPQAGHACRIQGLAGSFDLLPTMETFLGSAGASEEASPPDVPQVPDASESDVSAPHQLSSVPQSLAFLCGAPQVCPDRLLKLQGDGWKGARTQEFLLVISEPEPPENQKTGHDGSEVPSRRLFVKPEDRFNVNDVAGTYATAADELARLMNSLD